MTDDPPPEVPAPPWHQPREPRPTEPPPVPLVDMPDNEPATVLRRHRRVMLSGLLDHDEASRVCLELMALDGASDAPVSLTVNSSGGGFGPALAVLDVIELMRAPVEVTVVGTAAGTATVVLAAGTGGRRVARHASVSMRVRHHEQAEGSADDVSREADRVAADRARLVDALAEATGQPAELVDSELERGGIMSAEEAVAFGLADEVVGAAPGSGPDSSTR